MRNAMVIGGRKTTTVEVDRTTEAGPTIEEEVNIEVVQTEEDQITDKEEGNGVLLVHL